MNLKEESLENGKINKNYVLCYYKLLCGLIYYDYTGWYYKLFTPKQRLIKALNLRGDYGRQGLAYYLWKQSVEPVSSKKVHSVFIAKDYKCKDENTEINIQTLAFEVTKYAAKYTKCYKFCDISKNF